MKKLIISIIGIFLLIDAYSQQDILDAFSASYAHEESQDYKKALGVLESVYTATSYEMNMRLGYLHYLDKNYPKSVSYYRQAIKLMPYAFEAKLGLVNPLAAMGNWTEIEQIYLEILNIDPMNTLVNYRMGLINYNRQNYSLAKKYLDKVINLYPMDYDTVILQAWTNLQMGNTREAKILFNKVLLIKPRDESALDGLDKIQ